MKSLREFSRLACLVLAWGCVWMVVMGLLVASFVGPHLLVLVPVYGILIPIFFALASRIGRSQQERP